MNEYRPIRAASFQGYCRQLLPYWTMEASPVFRQRSANTGRHSAMNPAVHIHAAASGGASLGLAVFDARFYIGVRCVDEPG
jgi:hypothetical protein